ncbi:MAG: DMT family transporter [Opitutales bacterium]
MTFPFYLFFPLFSAFGYALSALFLKKAIGSGVGPWRTTFVTNMVMGVLFLPFVIGHTDGLAALHWRQPFFTAVVFLVGQVFTFLALSRGDVSVATPLMGTKVIFVAFFTVVVLRESVPLPWWVAAFLASVAIALLRGGSPAAKKRLGITVLFALVSASAFAMADILTQKWGGIWGFRRFAPVMFFFVALLSLGFIPFFKEGIFKLPANTWKWLGGGSLLLALQALGISYVLTEFGNATAVNIVYSSRGVWSIVLVLLIGHWFGNQERTDEGDRVMGTRLIGAVLLLVAVVLVTVEY